MLTLPFMLNELNAALAGQVQELSPSLVTLVGRRVNATGTVWDSDGLVLTANHNLPRKAQPRVLLNGGQEVTARVLGRDRALDLALLKVELDLPVPTWVDEGESVGHLVLALANPGQGVRATWGLVSSTSDAWRTHGGGEVDRYIDVDGSLPRGFSGGPLVGSSGLLGLNTRGLVRGGTTLPTPTLRRVVQALLADGRVKRGWLGVGARPVDGGLLVDFVAPNGPAERSGLLVGDIVQKVGAVDVARFEDLRAVLNGQVGETVELSILRGGEPKTVSVTIEEKTSSRC